MKNGFLLIIILWFVFVSELFAGASAEGSGSNRGTYLTRNGYIIPEEEIRIEHYIAQYDYDYPLPEHGELTVTTASGFKGTDAYILFGLKGKKEDFSELPPLNITFCIDRSGSMTPVMPWVMDSFYIFIDRVREGDVISLVDMDTRANVIIPPTIIRSQDDRTRFKREVDRIRATGGTDIYAGMRLSYTINETSYNPSYINRVIILTDGMHNFGQMINSDILNLAAEYKKKGINISTVMYGIQAATGLMTDVAIEGGGSSRFISDHDEMERVFRNELDRMLVPAARELQMRLTLSPGVTLKNTWGYQHYQEGTEIHYYLPTLHNGDYETIFVELAVSPNRSSTNLGTLYIDYLDLGGSQKTMGPYQINLYVPENNTNQEIADARVREVEGLLTFARGLIDIANKTTRITSLQRELSQYRNPSPQRSDVVNQIQLELSQNLQITNRLSNYLSAINTSLGGEKYEKELEILQNYARTFTEVHDDYTNENRTQ